MLFVRTLPAQPESMGAGMTGPLTLGPMGEEREGCAFWLIISFILDLAAHSKQLSFTS